MTLAMLFLLAIAVHLRSCLMILNEPLPYLTLLVHSHDSDLKTWAEPLIVSIIIRIILIVNGLASL